MVRLLLLSLVFGDAVVLEACTCGKSISLATLPFVIHRTIVVWVTTPTTAGRVLILIYSPVPGLVVALEPASWEQMGRDGWVTARQLFGKGVWNKLGLLLQFPRRPAGPSRSCGGVGDRGGSSVSSSCTDARGAFGPLA
jgi:hypothetical protein